MEESAELKPIPADCTADEADVTRAGIKRASPRSPKIIALFGKPKTIIELPPIQLLS